MLTSNSPLVIILLRHNRIFLSTSVYFYYGKNTGSFFARLLTLAKVVSQQLELCVFRCVASAAHFLFWGKNTMKKTLATILALVITACIFAACSATPTLFEPNIPTQTFNHQQPIPPTPTTTSAPAPITPQEYTLDSNLFNEGMIIIEKPGEKYSDTSYYGYMDTNGTVSIEEKYVSAADFYDGFAFVTTDDNKLYTIDKRGNVLSERAIPDAIYEHKDSYSYASYCLLSYRLGMIDSTGNILNGLNYYFNFSSKSLKSGLVEIYTVDENSINEYGGYDSKKYGLYDSTNKKLYYLLNMMILLFIIMENI